MTAKEIAESCYCYDKGMYIFDDDDLHEFIDQLCMEQRELCIKKWLVSPDTRIQELEAIRNAPQPEAL